jgi:hypothetical protein
VAVADDPGGLAKGFVVGEQEHFILNGLSFDHLPNGDFGTVVLRTESESTESLICRLL